MRRFTIAITAAAVVVFAFAVGAQQEQERPKGFQAYCFWGDADWFGPCRLSQRGPSRAHGPRQTQRAGS